MRSRPLSPRLRRMEEVGMGGQQPKNFNCPPPDRSMFNHPSLPLFTIMNSSSKSIYIMARAISEQDFQNTVLDNKQPVVLDFWAAWCGPCRMLEPTVEELAQEYEGKALIGKVNVDENPQIAMEYGIRSIPTLLFFKDGKLVDRAVGVLTKAQLTQRIEDLLTVKV